MKQSKVLGNISSIDTMGLVDGPGIRVVVFLQGCKLDVYIATIQKHGVKRINLL